MYPIALTSKTMYLAVILVKTEEIVKFIVVFKRYLSKKWMNVMIDNL